MWRKGSSGGGEDKRNIFLGTLGRKGRGSDDDDDEDDNSRIDKDSMDVEETSVSKNTKNAAAKWQDMIVEDTLGDAMGSLSKTSIKRSGLHDRGVENYMEWKNLKPKKKRKLAVDGDEKKMDAGGGGEDMKGQGQDQSSVSKVTAGVVTGQEKVKKPFVPKNPFGSPRPPPAEKIEGQLELPITGRSHIDMRPALSGIQRVLVDYSDLGENENPSDSD